MSKFTSRKFLLAVAAFLGSLGTSITGIFTGTKCAIIIGNVCMMLSAAIYAGAEAFVDAAAVDKGVEIIEEEETEDEDN